MNPFSVRYGGAYANDGILEAGELARSISGAAKLYTAAIHYCFLGTVPRGRYRKEYACYVTASRPGSLEEIFALLPLVQGFGLHADFYREAATHTFKTIVGAVVKLWLQPSAAEETAGQTGEGLMEDIEKVPNLDSLLANGLAQSNRQLTVALVESNKRQADLNELLVRTLGKTLPNFAARTRPFGRDFVEPAGNSCGNIAQFEGVYETRISDSDAEIIRGDDDTEVDPMASFKVNRISEINVKTGHCILVLDELLRIVPGKISDPSLQKPNNVYTSALNAQQGFMAHAKAVRKGGQIQRLYISDAEPLNSV